MGLDKGGELAPRNIRTPLWTPHGPKAHATWLRRSGRSPFAKQTHVTSPSHRRMRWLDVNPGGGLPPDQGRRPRGVEAACLPWCLWNEQGEERTLRVERHIMCDDEGWGTNPEEEHMTLPGGARCEALGGSQPRCIALHIAARSPLRRSQAKPGGGECGDLGWSGVGWKCLVLDKLRSFYPARESLQIGHFTNDLK